VATSRNVASRKQKLHTKSISFNNAKTSLKSSSDKPNIQPVDIVPQPFEDTWSPCASSRGVKLLLSTTSCATCRTLKSSDVIGAYLQAKVIGRSPSMLSSLACPSCLTKTATVLPTPENTGMLNFRNGSTHKDSSNLLPNHPSFSDMTSTIIVLDSHGKPQPWIGSQVSSISAHTVP
jgi:hypothetical protein